MLTLGIETSGHQGSVAMLRDGRLLGERNLSREGRRHARTLVPELRELLQAHALTPGDVQTLAVSIGPGSFTGLRVGVVCAKSWAYATAADIVAVDTLQAVAQQAPATARRLQVISDAQRGELFVGRFEQSTAGCWSRLGDIEITSTGQWIAGLSADELVSGPGLVKLADQLQGKCRLVAADRWQPTAASVALLGERSALEGRTDDYWTIEPLYLRRSAAEEKADNR